jgi:putative ABC transport system permease protein
MERLSTLAFRNARLRPVRTLLTIAGIILGVAVIVSILITNQSIYEGFEALFADVAGSAHLTVEAASKSDDGFNQQALEQVRAVAGVMVAVPSTANDTMLILSDREISLTAYGVDPAIDTQVRPYRIVVGSFLGEDERHTVVVVEDIADRYDIEVGEDLTLLGADGPTQLLVIGIMAKEGPARRAQVILPLEVSQEIFARGSDVDAIDVVAEEEIAHSKDSLDQLKATLQNELGTSYEVLYPAARAETIVEALQGISVGLSFFAATALFGGAYLIFNTFSMTVVERTREIGMLRAVGATKGQTFRLIVTEATILGLAGSLFGLLLGLLLAVPMTRMMAQGFGVGEIELSIPPHSFVVGFIAGMVVTVASALVPAIQAGRTSPVEALAVRGRGLKSNWIIRRGWIPGLALAVFSELTSYIPIPDETARTGIELVSFLMLLIGVTLLIPLVTRLLERITRPVMSVIYGNEGRIGSRNINRALGRTSITVGALTMGVLMFVVLGAQTTSMISDVRDWMDAALRGDLFVSSFQPMRLRLADDLAEVEGVNLITPMRFQQVKVVGTTAKGDLTARDDDIAFIAVDPLEYVQISEFEFASGQGDESAMLNQLLEGGAVFIATSIAQRYGIEKGDAIRLRTARGDHDFLVGGVIVDYTQGGWSVTGTWEDLKRYFRTDKAHIFVVEVVEGVSAETVRQRMEAQYGKRRHIEVESGEVYRDRWLKQMRGIMRLFDAIVYIGLVIGALGVTNTMTMNVLERIREIGCLRAVGMTRSQVVKMVLAEALIIGFLGGLFGLAFGTFIAFYAVQGMEQGTGWELSFILPPTVLVVGLLIALGASQIAALYPAWRAAKINIVKAVQYE